MSKPNNLESVLATTQWILDKVQSDMVYAQHLYAALCNNDFQRNDMWPILKNEIWSCSWRQAGSIVAGLEGQGDYMNWYCSGIKLDPLSQDEFDALSEENKAHYKKTSSYLSEGVVTDEIREDLFKLGWNVVSDPDDSTI